MNKGLFIATLVAAFACRAATPGGYSPPFKQCPAVGQNTSCGVLVIITDVGTFVAQDSTQGPYDGNDDTLIGVVNNSSKTVTQLPLSSSQPIFGFESDGLCTFITCSWPNPTTYEGPITSFSGISADMTSGVVNFSPGLAPGQSTYFSLELSIVATCQPFTAGLLMQTDPTWAMDTYDHLYVTKTFPDESKTVVAGGTTVELAIFPSGVGQPGDTGVTKKPIAIAAGTLDGLRDAINKANVGATATVLSRLLNSKTVYYLSLAVTVAATDTLQLRTTAGAPNTNILRDISAKGCYLTSAAMLINYYAGGVVTNPRKLNNWLNSQAMGYLGQGLINANLIPAYAQTLGVSIYFKGLEEGRDDFTLNTYLCSGNPVILEVAGHPQHFVLATGQATVNGQSTYNINDPGFTNSNTLADRYSNTYTGLRLFSSTASGPNSLAVAAHSPVELLVTDASGNKTGYDRTTGATLTQIPGSGYSHESIADDEDPVNQPPTDEVKLLHVPQAASGAYKLQLTGTDSGAYSLDFVGFDANGSQHAQTMTGTASAGSVATYSVGYSSTPGAAMTVAQVPSPPTFNFAASHSGYFTQGQTGATFTLGVANAAGAQPTSGPVTVTVAPAPGITVRSLTGPGWGCAGGACTRSDTLAGGANYPAITVTADVGATAACSLTNTATVGGGGAINISASDPTGILPASHPGLFSAEEPLGSGAYYLQFPAAGLFGYYSYLPCGWVYHFDMGYEYVVSATTANAANFWDASSGHWWYVAANQFPYIYDYTLGAWIYYLPDSQHAGRYSSNPRYFSNLSTKQIFTM